MWLQQPNSTAHQTFTSEDGEHKLIIIKSGWQDQYHIIQEDAYQNKPDGKNILLSSAEIKEQFNLDITF